VEEKTKYDHKYYKVELTLIAHYPKQVYYHLEQPPQSFHYLLDSSAPAAI
jgi:hypothetical protein